jgi:CheY-like chemotaxis protein
MKNAQGQDIHSMQTGWLHRLQSFLHNDGKPVGGAPDRMTRSAPVARFATATSRKVLVVDDNPVNLMVASEMLSAFNVSTLMAADGAEAVALAGELPLDLILMDLQMPVLDGLSALRQIRAVEVSRQRPRVPTLAYTSSAPAWAVMQACGFDGLLAKPCDHAALRNSLQRWAPQLLQEVVVPRPRPLQPWPHHAPREAVAAGVNGPGALPG